MKPTTSAGHATPASPVSKPSFATRAAVWISGFPACFRDGRDPARVEHKLAEILAQRLLGLAPGYEDLNDHEELRHDPLLALLAGQL
jgi:hypothetical protein